MEQPTEFLQFSDLGKLYGLTLVVYMSMAVLVAVNVIGEKYHKLIALGISLAFAFAYVALSTPEVIPNYVIAIPNAFMAFLAAAGLSNVIAAGQAKRQPSVEAEKNLDASRMWWSRW